VEKFWLTASIVTCKLVIAFGVDFFKLLVYSVVPYLRLLAIDVYFEDCIVKLYYV